MTDRGAYVLSVAILLAAGMLAFAPRREGPSPTPATPPPAASVPVVQAVQLGGKDGKTVIVAVMPDGRYLTWKQFGSDGLSKDESGTITGK